MRDNNICNCHFRCFKDKSVEKSSFLQQTIIFGKDIIGLYVILEADSIVMSDHISTSNPVAILMTAVTRETPWGNTTVLGGQT